MNEPLRERAYRLFVAALELPLGAQAAFLDAECGGDAELRRWTAGLLDAASRDALATHALGGTLPAAEESMLGRTFGRFRLIERIGAGGMGVVYRGERTDDVAQAVAVKLLGAGVDAAAGQRFRREAQLLARVEHPGVARLIDVGVEEGRAWLAMEFVRGERIDAYCDAHALGVRDRVRLLADLAAAVSAAHGMLVVHSDIKPSNVLVTEAGAAKLIDFGISSTVRDLSGGAVDEPTPAGRSFSPSYAAPEQIDGGAITVVTDVFGLGALGYRLLCGAPPHATAITPVGYMIAVTQHDVELPSRAAADAGRPATEAQALRGDLDAILRKALERDPARRYVSAAALHADLERYLDSRPVEAHPASWRYRLGKFVARHSVPVALAGFLILSLIAGGVAATLMARRALLARDMAARRGEFLEHLLTSANPGNGRRDVTVAELLDGATATLHASLGGEPLVEASMLGLIAETNLGLDRLPEGLAANDRELVILRARGGDRGELASALLTRAKLYREQGNWQQTEVAVRGALSLLRRAAPSADLCTALDILGITLAHTSREREAESVLHEEIDIESRGDPTLEKMRRYPFYALAVMLGELGRYADAATAGRQALELARQELPHDHPDLLAIENAYASTLVSNGEGAAAEPLFRDVIAADTRVLGARHKGTLLAQYALADDLAGLGRTSEAVPIALDAAHGLEELLGTDNLYTWGAWQLYGTSACAAGEESAGLSALERVEAARRRIYPPQHWAIFSTLIGIGDCLSRQARYAEAEHALVQGIAGLEMARGASFRRTQEGYQALHAVYLALGRPQDAAQLEAKFTP